VTSEDYTAGKYAEVLFWRAKNRGIKLIEFRLDRAGFTQEQIDTITAIMDSVCPACKESDRGCYCMCDD